MKDLFIVASHTFKDLVRRKSFIISNIIILLIIVIAFNVPNIIEKFTGQDEQFGKTKILLIDKNNILDGNTDILKQLGEYEIYVEKDEITNEQIEEKIRNEEMDAVIIEKQNEKIYVNYLVESIGMTSIIPDDLMIAIENTYRNIQMSKLNITQEQLANLNMPFEVEMNQIEEKEAGGNILVMMLLSIVLFYAIYFYAYQVSTSITTEKTSKIIETLVTSTSPRTIVIGKTIGIGLAGVMQTIVTVIVAIICAKLFLTPEMVNSVLDMSNITPLLAVITICYYILGYSLFALLYALTGSTVSKPEDIQSANGPVAILAVIGFYLSYFTMMNPASSLNKFAAIFPISSPFCMPFRVMMGMHTIPELLISVIVLLITILVIAKVSIKIYSSAILNYGTKMNLKDIIRIYKNKND